MKHYSDLKLLVKENGLPNPTDSSFAMVDLKIHQLVDDVRFSSDFYSITYFKSKVIHTKEAIPDFQIYPYCYNVLNPGQPVETRFLSFYRKRMLSF